MLGPLCNLFFSTFWESIGDGPGLDHNFFRLGPAPPMPPLLLGLLAHTCMRTPPHWEPM
jgi:hypothetical protein